LGSLTLFGFPANEKLAGGKASDKKFTPVSFHEPVFERIREKQILSNNRSLPTPPAMVRLDWLSRYRNNIRLLIVNLIRGTGLPFILIKKLFLALLMRHTHAMDAEMKGKSLWFHFHS